MAAPLLYTKLAAPPLRAERIARPRLVEKLNAGLRHGHKLTLLSAPAGYGKTTLVATWLQTLEPKPTGYAAQNTAWLSLDEHDNDLARFLAYLVAALQTIEGSIGQTLQGLLHVPHLPPVESLLTPLLNELAVHPTPIVLVLDDLHASTIPALYPALEFWLDQAPPHVHTVLITRQDPPLPLARWRVRGQMTEIRQRDLRFTPTEATAFFARSLAGSLSVADVTVLEQRTEGWIAGLQMAALALQDADAGEVSQIIARFSGRHHFVLDYLTDEVLRRQSTPVRTFLLHTSILEQVSGPLCDWLITGGGDRASSEGWGVGDAQYTLEYLERANLFVVPLDAQRTWYRYHRLFAELLRARLRATRPDVHPTLHRRAAVWYEQEGWGTEAVHHALKAGDAEWAAGVMERVLQQRTAGAHLDATTLLAWIAALPPQVVRARPNLQILAARAYYVTGQRDRAESTLRDLERALRRAPESPGARALLASIAADRASYAAMRGEVRAALKWARPTLANLLAGALDAPLAQIRPASVLGLASLRAGDVTEAARAFKRAIAAAKQAGIHFAAIPLLCNLAEVRFVQGQLRRSLLCCDRAEKLATNSSPADSSSTDNLSAVDGRPAQGLGFVLSMQAKVAYERGDLDAAASYARQAVERLSRSGVTLSQETLYGLLARIEQALGAPNAANAALERALQIARGNDVPRLLSLALADQARVRLAQGALDAAARWADEYAQSEPTEYLREFEDLTLARVRWALGQPDAALIVLDGLLPPAERTGRWGTAIRALVLRALALHAMGQPDQAFAPLCRALERAEPEGYVRPFIEGGTQMKELLLHVSHSPHSDAVAHHVARLLVAFGPRPPEPSRSRPAASLPQPLIEPLTAREIDVLCLLAQGLTNAEIGQQLVISLPTVKSHTRNLYGKLDVHNRRQAVTRARELGLLNDPSP